MNVLVTDGDNRSALAVVRSLGQKGHRIYVTASGRKSLASCSSHCFCGVALPPPLVDGQAFVDGVVSLSQREKIGFVFPMTEQSIYLLNKARSSLPENTRLACPPGDVMQAVSDKARLFQLAQSLGVAMPRTFYVNGADGLASVLEQIDCFPVVVKPAFSKVAVGNGFLSGGVRYAANRLHLEKIYATSPVLRYPSLIQEKIPGQGTGLFTLYDKNRHLAVFSHQRLREKPPSGGVSVVCQSVAPDQEMVKAADRLLSAVGFAGVAMVEFKRDQRDGKAKLMEINGRFWGSLQLSVTCGVDFPSLYIDYLQGNLPSPLIREYKVNQRMKWFFGTIDHLLIRLRQNPTSLNLSAPYLSKSRTFLDFLRIWEPGTSFDVFKWNDIRPFLYETLSYIIAFRKVR